MLIFIFIIVLLTNIAVTQWEPCRTGPIIITLNGKEIKYLFNTSETIELPPSMACQIQVIPSLLTVAVIYVTGTNFTNSTAALHYDSSSAQPLSIMEREPKNFAFPPCGMPCSLMLISGNADATKLSIRFVGEPVEPDGISFTLSQNTTKQISLESLKQSSSMIAAPNGYHIGVLVDYYSAEMSSTSNTDAISTLRNQIFFSNISYLNTASTIYQLNNGVYPSGTQFLTLFSKIKTNAVNLVVFAYKVSSQNIWSSYSFGDWRRANFSTPATTSLSVKIVGKPTENTDGMLTSVNWLSSNQLDIFEGIPDVTTLSIFGNNVTTLTRNISTSMNTTVKLPAALYSFVSRGGSVGFTLKAISSHSTLVLSSSSGVMLLYFMLIQFL
ncbi:hypothetical protein DICVIV_04989 [Dictyocaulus viviparus]|uniref:CUB-like domain-containing protein n=1 Tax=Dictyocaulus viviparus TaxID=29172 RepID=A0A0D8XW54_DICVI|nr:hypothetical protein DICVIV_04989 [Dictyocaulus viviparus]